MATKIVTKNSSTAGAAPTATDLVQGELAVNVADKRLFTEDNGGSIVELGTNPSTLTVTGEITANGGIALGDNDRIKLGDGPDLQIWHNGSNSYVMDSGTGNLKLLGSAAVEIQSQADNSNMIVATAGGAVTLYNANSPKLDTTSTGIDVTGTASATSVTSAQHLTAGSAYSLLFGDGGERISGNNSSSLLNFFTGATERMRIDSSGNVLVGTTVSGVGVGNTSTGHNINANGALLASRTTTGDTSVAYFNRNSSDGKIAEFYKDGTTVGSIGTRANLLTIGNGDTGLLFNSTNDSIIPESMSGVASRDAAIDLGHTSARFKDLYLSGTATMGGLTVNTTNGSSVFEGTGISSVGLQFKTNASNRFLIQTPSGSADLAFLAAGTTERMRIDSSGNVGIGRTPTQTLDVNGTVRISDNVFGGYFGAGSSLLVAGAASDFCLRSDAVLSFASGGPYERMRIDSSGNLLVGSSSTMAAGVDGIQLYQSIGQIGTARNSTGGANHHVFFNPNGLVGAISTSGSSTVYGTSSDQRLKDNIADADDAGSKIDAIQVRQYDWKADGSHQDYGMIAQELQAVAPEAVSGDADSEEMMGVDYSKLVPMLIKEIQSLRNRVAQLETGE